jgi:hypothetical protein
MHGFSSLRAPKHQAPGPSSAAAASKWRLYAQQPSGKRYVNLDNIRRYEREPEPHTKLPLAEVLDNVRKALRGNNPLDGKNTSVGFSTALRFRLACCSGSLYIDRGMYCCCSCSHHTGNVHACLVLDAAYYTLLTLLTAHKQQLSVLHSTALSTVSKSKDPWLILRMAQPYI